MSTKVSYFIQTFAVILVAAICFLVFKEFLPKRIFSDVTVAKENVVIDSLLLESFETASASPSIDTFTKKKIVFNPTEGIVFPTETYETYNGYQFLIPFYEKLYQLETTTIGNVRIAYFGDSMTDGDMIVQDLRKQIQSKFGGNGVGFVSVSSESAASRSSISHQYSPNWKKVSYVNVKRPEKPFGVNGHVFFANDTLNNPWVKFKAGPLKNATQLNNPTLFYGSSTNKDGKVIVRIDKDSVVYTLNPERKLNTLSLNASAVKSFKVEFSKADSIPIYGFNFDDGKGVHVDNFSSRGNSGLPISLFNVDLMHQFQEKLGYDLIILHFGTNVLNYGTYSYDWYEKRMTRVVNHIKECFPGVSILVVSTADKSTKYDLEMQTDSAVVPLTLAQRKYAVQSNSAYFNLFQAMGGEGSMVKWVDEEVPPLANKDYTHFNYKGSQKVATLLHDQIQKGYEQYKMMRSKRKINVQPKIKSQPIDTLMPKNQTIDGK